MVSDIEKTRRSVICGAGEVGTALASVLEQYHPVLIDPRLGVFVEPVLADYLVIAFPFSATFIQEVRDYQERFKPLHTIICSTVPVGTSRELDAVHSPIVGLHPFIEAGIRTFTRFLSGSNASDVADYFRRAGLTVYLFDDQETTELLKVVDTSFYALCIEYTKEIKRLCEKHGVPFEAWRIYNEDYSSGYASLGYPEYIRPTLVPIMKKQGGHCTIPNLEFLESDFAEFIKKQNERTD